MKKQIQNSTFNTIKKMRGDWNGVIPVTKIIPNKKRNQKIKHKGRQFNYD